MTNEQLAIEMAYCTEAIISTVINCTNVILSGSKERGAMESAYMMLSTVQEFSGTLVDIHEGRKRNADGKEG